MHTMVYMIILLLAGINVTYHVAFASVIVDLFHLVDVMNNMTIVFAPVYIENIQVLFFQSMTI